MKLKLSLNDLSMLDTACQLRAEACEENNETGLARDWRVLQRKIYHARAELKNGRKRSIEVKYEAP